jgi:phenylacetate-CoA ligase
LEAHTNVGTGRTGIEQVQLEKLHALLREVSRTNVFYRQKLGDGVMAAVRSLDDLKRLPFTTKQELIEDQTDHPLFGSNLTFPMDRYVRVHQTSGTTGRPLYWLDTEESWEWWGSCWRTIFEAAGVGPQDRVFFPFSFGPFIGFWSGWEGARKVGALAVSGGGQSTQQRLKTMIEYGATVLVCTPTYALHMAAEARRLGLDPAKDCAVRVTIHAGEPGASIPSTKRRIEESWAARCFDHTGATEVGAFGFRCEALEGGVHVNEDHFIAEVVDVSTGQSLEDGVDGELVITNLGRVGSPVIRYRTGDRVKAQRNACGCGRSFLVLDGGVLGRVDDMVVVRGVNVFPSAVESVIREFREVEEFRVDVIGTEGLSELKITLEPREGVAEAGLKQNVAEAVRMKLELRPTVEVVETGTLPRFELKARRFFRH